MNWICLSISNHFLHYHGEEALDDLFFEIFGSDYIEHYKVDSEEDHPESDHYVFLHCREYKPYIDKIRSHRYIKNALNSFSDITIIPEEEIMEMKSSAPQIIHDGDYLINRTGFFMFGDIVQVLKGSLSSINGIIIKRCDDNSDFYYVYFRLFVNSFYKKIHISNLEFNTSIFKYFKSPVVKGSLTESNKRIKKIIKKYKKLQKEYKHKKLVESPIREIDNILETAEECDITNLLFSDKKGTKSEKN